jgi:hypothetical protein
MAPFELATKLAVLTAGRNPQWDPQLIGGVMTYTGIPASLASGVNLQDAVVTLLQVELRENVAYRTGRVTVNTLVASQTWTVSINGNAVAFAAGPADTWATIIAGLIAALPGVPAADALVTFGAEDSDGDTIDDTLVVRGKDEADYTIAVSATGGAAMDLAADANSANLILWRAAKTTTQRVLGAGVPQTWSIDPAFGVGGVAAVDEKGVTGYQQTNGYSRIYGQLDTVAGPADSAGAPGVSSFTARVLWGPCIDE